MPPSADRLPPVRKPVRTGIGAPRPEIVSRQNDRAARPAGMLPSRAIPSRDP